MIIRGDIQYPPIPTIHGHIPVSVSVGAGSMFLAGKKVEWCDRRINLTWNPSWFKHRIDLIVMDEDYGPTLIEGTPAFWSKVAPEVCKEGQVILSTVQVPSRLQALLQRWKSVF